MATKVLVVFYSMYGHVYTVPKNIDKHSTTRVDRPGRRPNSAADGSRAGVPPAKPG